jgi:gamma-glutamyl:cysteine ligase YbdK (ATP-grasp superfamily)
MGDAVYKDSFSASERAEFARRLQVQLESLRELLQSPAFSVNQPSLGAELELYLVDNNYQPAAISEALLQQMANPQLTPELNRYNLEFNMTPVSARGHPFAAMERELRQLMQRLQETARGMQGNILPIGILPTLQQEHLSQDYMTDRPRYHALSRGITALRGSGYDINIDGDDPLSMHGEGVTVEGANTSFQVHLRVPAERFAAWFNAAQLTTPLVLALAANSPLIAGHRLWQESRIALFKQSIDYRQCGNPGWREPARVSFGHGWVREGAWELFAENVALYPPLIPALFAEQQEAVPVLPELCLHHGTIWPWNRAVYDHHSGGHLRIEFRSLPAGPTITDMLANAAVSIGWAVGLQDRIDHYMAGLPFRFAEYNFYRAAQFGLDAQLIWPKPGGVGLEQRPVTELISELLPLAAAGTAELGVTAADTEHLWDVLQQRLAMGSNGASWQLRRFAAHRQTLPVAQACSAMLAEYVENVMVGAPVATWC